MKRILSIAIALIMVFSLAACGNSTEEPNVTDNAGNVTDAGNATETPDTTNKPETDTPALDTSWAANEFEAVLPELPFTGWTTKQNDDQTYKMELFGLNTSAATNEPDSGEPDGADKTKLKNYLDSLSTYGFTVEETGEDYQWLVKDANGNQAEFMCADGGCWITITKAN